MHLKKQIILDFDGTVCKLFENYSLESVKREIAATVSKYGIDFSQGNDAFDIFNVLKSADIEESKRDFLLSKVDTLLTEAENGAAENCGAIDGFLDFLEWAKKCGKTVSFASNNSESCIKAYLARHKVTGDIKIVGRIGTHPELMKPNPYVLEKACEMLGCKSSDAVFIGDHPRDYECAKSFNTSFIGMVPTESKRSRMEAYAKTIPLANDFYDLAKLLSK